MGKKAGSNAERQLVHEFWKNGWAAIRVAGSGTMRYPCPDLIVGKKDKKYVIECKTTQKTTKYFTKEQIGDLKLFSDLFGAFPYVAVRFGKKGWFFVSLNNLDVTENGFVLSFDNALKKGERIKDII